ncbi:MAG TPA: hypothetical protein VEC35_09235 [Noviherbaspirillum sp.]|nr:hypothetical protein [Noviherbaspirillum sp.]
MTNAIKHLVQYALCAGTALSVYDGRSWTAVESTNEDEILSAISSATVAQIRIHQAGEILGVAIVSCSDQLQDHDGIIDYTVSTFIDTWRRDYLANHHTAR